MGYYTDLWNKQKQSGVYQTTSGGKVYASESAKQADQAVQAAVQSAAQQQASGNIKTTSGGTVKTTPKVSTSSTYTPKTTGVTIPSVVTPSFVPTMQAAKTTSNPRQIASAIPNGGSIATSDRAKAVANQYYKYPQMFRNGQLQDIETTLSDEVTAPTSYGQIATASRYQLPASDPGINYDTINMLLNRYGMTANDLGGLPVEALYLGNNKYALPYLLNNPDNQTMLSNGNLITVGDYRQALMDGLYLKGNEAALNDWYGTVAQNPDVRTVDPYVAEEAYGYEGDDYSMPDYVQSLIDAQNAQYQALINSLQGQSGVLDQQYANSAQDLYANYMRQGLALPEQLAGTATGTADSMLLQNDLNYQNNLYQNELARQAAQQDLQNQINQYGAEAAVQQAQTAAEWAQLMWQQEQAEKEAEREYQLALAKAQQSAANSANDEAKPKITAAQALNSWENGYDTPEIRSALMYYYGYVPEETTANTGASSPLTPIYTTLPQNKLEEGLYLNNLLRLNAQK